MKWLMQKDIYSPPPDRDVFIDRNLFSFLSLLAKVRRAGNPPKGTFYRVNPTIKLFFTFFLILLLSLTQSLHYVLMVDAFILLTLSFLELSDIKRTASILFSVSIFTVIILLSVLIAGNTRNTFILMLKIAGSVMSANVLAHSTKWSHLTRSLRVFRLPDLLILVLDIAVKYIVILGEFSLNMFYALKLRSIGRNDRKYRSAGNLLGVLFIKSKEMSELTYSAMECRGFDGRYNTRHKHHFHPVDFVYIPIHMIVLAAFFMMK